MSNTVPRTCLAEVFSHLSRADLFTGAAFLEPCPKGWPSDAMRCYFIGKVAFIQGASINDWAGLPHPAHFITGHSQEASDLHVAVQGYRGNLPQRRA